jgi:hypothetical protein
MGNFSEPSPEKDESNIGNRDHELAHTYRGLPNIRFVTNNNHIAHTHISYVVFAERHASSHGQTGLPCSRATVVFFSIF